MSFLRYLMMTTMEELTRMILFHALEEILFS